MKRGDNQKQLYSTHLSQKMATDDKSPKVKFKRLTEHFLVMRWLQTL